MHTHGLVHQHMCIHTCNREKGEGGGEKGEKGKGEKGKRETNVKYIHVTLPALIT